MKRITDLYSHIDDTELYCKDGAELLDADADALSEEETERILQNALQAVHKTDEGHNKSKSRRQGRKKWILLLTAAVLLAAFSASAAEYFHLKSQFKDYLLISSDADEKLIKSMATDIETEQKKSSAQTWKTEAENGGVKLSLSQTIGDGENLYLYFDVTLPEGMYKESEEGIKRMVHFHNNFVEVDGKAIKDTLSRTVVKEDPSVPGHYYIIASLNRDEPFNDKEISLTLKDLGYVESAPSYVKWFSLVPGEWKFNWKPDYEDVTKTLNINKEIMLKDRPFLIERILLSPLSIKITGAEGTADRAETESIYLDELLLTDGSHIKLNNSYSGPEKDRFVAGTLFDSMIDMNTIKGIRINGQDVIFSQ